MEILEMTNLELKGFNNNTKLTLIPNSLGITDLSFKQPQYIRKHTDNTTTIYLSHPIKGCYKRKLGYCRCYFKPKDETNVLTIFEHKYGLLKITTEGKYYIEIDYVKQ